jgi:hypothetical protein
VRGADTIDELSQLHHALLEQSAAGAGHEGYVTVGLYPNGQPGEIFIRMAKEGSTIAGSLECFGTVASVALQHWAPLARTLANSNSRRIFMNCMV